MMTVYASDEYGQARAELLAAESALDDATARVDELRAALPPGPVVDPATPLTTAMGKPITLGGLVGKKRGLLAYHLAFDEGGAEVADRWVDVLDALVPHAMDAVAVLSPASPGELTALGRARGWGRVPLVSTQPGALTDLLKLRRTDGGLEAAVTCFALDEDGVLRLRWRGRANWGVLDATCRNSLAVGR